MLDETKLSRGIQEAPEPFHEGPVTECYLFSSMLEPSSGQACSQEFGVQFSFRFKFPAIMQSGSGHSIFFQNQTRCSEVAATA